MHRPSTSVLGALHSQRCAPGVLMHEKPSPQTGVAHSSMSSQPSPLVGVRYPPPHVLHPAGPAKRHPSATTHAGSHAVGGE